MNKKMTKQELKNYIISEAKRLFVENEFDFVKSAIESASGDNVEKREQADDGSDLYWSLTDEFVNYYIGGDNEDDIIKYNAQTGERYPIGNLKHYNEPRRAKDEPDSLYFENEEILKNYIISEAKKCYKTILLD